MKTIEQLKSESFDIVMLIQDEQQKIQQAQQKINEYQAHINSNLAEIEKLKQDANNTATK